MLVCELIERLKTIDPLSKVYAAIDFRERGIEFKVIKEIEGIYPEGQYSDKTALFYLNTQEKI